MKERNKLKNTLRDYYDNQEIPFEENEWEKAGAYLSSARQGRKIRSFIFIFAGILAVISAGIFVLNQTGNEQQKLSYVQEQNPDLTPAVESSLNEAALIPAPKNNASSERRVELKQNIPQSAPERQQKSEATAETSSIALSPFTHQVSVPVPVDEKTKAKNVEQQTTLPVEAVPQDNLSEVNEEAVLKPEAPENSRHEAEIVSSSQPADLASTPSATTELPEQPLSSSAFPSLNKGKEESIEIKNDPPSEEKSQVTSPNSIKGTPDSTTALKNPVPDSTLKASDNLAGEGIFYEAGAAWFYGWQGASKRDARGFSPLVGINYMNRLNKRSALSFGIQYIRVPDLSNSSKTSRLSSFTYGEESRVTVITPTSLHYLLAPLRFHYYANDKNCFGAGVNIAYLLNVDAKVTSYDEKPGSTGNYETLQQSGYTQGFSWFDSQLALFYRRRMTNVLALQAEIYLGLTDVKQDAFFGLKTKERNSGAKLTLIYYAFRKNKRP